MPIYRFVTILITRNVYLLRKNKVSSVIMTTSASCQFLQTSDARQVVSLLRKYLLAVAVILRISRLCQYNCPRKKQTTNSYTEALCFAIYFATIVSMSEEEVSIAKYHEYRKIRLIDCSGKIEFRCRENLPHQPIQIRHRTSPGSGWIPSYI